MREPYKVHPDIICAWNGWGGYLASHLYPGARVLGMTPGQSAPEALDTLLQFSNSRDRAPHVLLHFDISDWTKVIYDVSDFKAAIQEMGGQVWNGAPLDLRKSHLQETARQLGYQSLRVTPDVSPDTKVIVKCNLNGLGKPELRLDDDTLALFGLEALRDSHIPLMTDHWVLNAGDLPDYVWEQSQNSSWLFVERYVARTDGAFFRTYIAQDRCIQSLATSDAPIKRMNNYEQQRQERLLLRASAYDPALAEQLGPQRFKAFEQAVRFADEIQLDFGCIDQVVDDDNEPFVVDVNATPYWGKQQIYPRPVEIVTDTGISLKRSQIDQLTYFKAFLRVEETTY